jgi:hypothetical protein
VNRQTSCFCCHFSVLFGTSDGSIIVTTHVFTYIHTYIHTHTHTHLHNPHHDVFYSHSRGIRAFREALSDVDAVQPSPWPSTPERGCLRLVTSRHWVLRFDAYVVLLHTCMSIERRSRHVRLAHRHGYHQIGLISPTN